MTDWRTIDNLPLRWKDGRTIRMRLSRLENQRELDAFWQDSGEMAGNWVAEDDGVVIRPQQYLHLLDDK
ncbi:hypothetical protein ACIGGE_03715 [Qipengyuania sp. NPDC077410]|jgi:hypothetical protein|uniref:hypothetical protein n=1 Tax=Qipengyuania sp. NPDC077410 TaxID=3364496 RepID=UPI0037C8D4D7